MRGLVFAILFCGLSLLFADRATTLLIRYDIIGRQQYDNAHTVIMVIFLVCYFGFAPYLTPSTDDKKNKNNC